MSLWEGAADKKRRDPYCLEQKLRFMSLSLIIFPGRKLKYDDENLPKINSYNNLCNSSFSVGVGEDNLLLS
jgi:hypothetical protein